MSMYYNYVGKRAVCVITTLGPSSKVASLLLHRGLVWSWGHLMISFCNLRLGQVAARLLSCYIDSAIHPITWYLST